MWWLYEIIENTTDYCVYRYSSGNSALDGVVRYDKAKKSIVVEKPCKADEGNDFCIRYAGNKFRHVISEGFPDRRQIACG